MRDPLSNPALKIVAMYPSEKDGNLTVLAFENGAKETFLPWFVQAKAPKVGAYLVTDKDGFKRCVDTLLP